MLPLINMTEQSYGRSMMKVKDIIEHAKKIGAPVAALTDIHSLSAAPDFLLQCQKSGIHGIAGLTVQIIEDKKNIGNIVLLGKGGRGFAALRDILEHVGHVGLDDELNPERGIQLSDLLDGKFKNSLENCISLDGFPGSIGEALIKRESEVYDVGSVKTLLDNSESLISRLKSQFSDGDYLGVKTQITQSPLASVLAMPANNISNGNERRAVLEVSMAFSKDETQSRQTMQWFKSYSKKYLEPLGTDSQINKMIMQKFIKATLEQGSLTEYKPSSPPFQNAEYLVSKCSTPNIFKNQPSSSLLRGREVNATLAEILESKWDKYSKSLPEKDVSHYKERLDYELDVISHCRFEQYFINIHKIQQLSDSGKNWSMLRGSAVASLVMHVMGLSPIDPIKEGLLFERFMNKDRIEDPDVDIEFVNPAGAIRGINDNFESGQMALLSSDKGVSKALKLLSLSKDALLTFYNIDDAAKKSISADFERLTAPLNDKKNKNKKWAGSLDNWASEIWDKTPDENKTKAMKALVGIAKNFNSPSMGSSVSPGSVIFVPEGVGRYFNLLPAHKGKTVEGAVPRIPQTKQNILPTGHIKYDLLANRSFTRSMNAWMEVGLPVEQSLDTDDQSIAFVFKKHAFMGVNQVSGYSGGMLAERFEPKNFSELTALNALIRDAGNPSTQGTIEQYLYFKDRPHEVKIDDVVRPILGETHGCLLYEEQLMKMLTVIGGFKWDEADVFRSSLKKGKGDIIDEYEAPFIKQAMEIHNVSQEQASSWYQPLREKRGRFVFNKAHAVAYAYVAVRQCWLKANYPAEYAAENFVDDEVSFRGRKVKLPDIIDDWVKLHGAKSPQKANDFLNAVGKVLLREEKIPESRYRRNLATIRKEIVEGIDSGAFNRILPDGWQTKHVAQYAEKVFEKIEARNYEPLKHGEISDPKENTATPKGSDANQTAQARKNNQDSNSKPSNSRESTGPATIPEGGEKPVNMRPGLIDWKNDVMIGHLLDFFSSEGIVTNLEMENAKAAYADHYKFTVPGKDGKNHSFYVAGISTNPVRAAKRNKKHSLTSGFYQGGERNRKRTDTLIVAAEILSITADQRFNHDELAKIGVEIKNGNTRINKESFKPLFSQLMKFAKNSKKPLYDSKSGGISESAKAPAKPTSPIMTEINKGQEATGHRLMYDLFENRRSINVNGLSAQIDNGHISIGEFYYDRFKPGKGQRKDLALFANYRKLSSDTPIFKTPLIVDNILSEGGHQRFILNREKQKTSTYDQGSTTSRIKGHVHGHVTEGSDFLWFAEAALDTWSLNELQRDIQECNKARGSELPFLEENAVSIKSAGGIKNAMEAMLSISIKEGDEKSPLDFCRVKKSIEAKPFNETESRGVKDWFKTNTIHWLHDGSDKNREEHQRLVQLMLSVGLEQTEISQILKVHNSNPEKTFNENVINVFDNNMKKETDLFLSQSNMETWLRSSDIAVIKGDDGQYQIGNVSEKIESGRMFSLMSSSEKELLSVELRKHYTLITGAKGVGLAVDNDTAGRKDAIPVYEFCNLIGLPVGSLMPKVETGLKSKVGDFTYDLKDHNDYLKTIRKMQKLGSLDEAAELITRYAGNIKLPQLDIDKPALDTKPVTDSQQFKP